MTTTTAPKDAGAMKQWLLDTLRNHETPDSDWIVAALDTDRDTLYVDTAEVRFRIAVEEVSR